MKLNGRLLGSSPPHSFSLPRPVGDPLLLQLLPLPLGFHQRLRQRGLVPPVPPIKVARDSAGKILRDPQGEVVTHADESHPDYLAAIELHHQRIAVLSIAEALREDPGLTFDTPRPVGTTGWIAYADALFDEMEAAGLTTGDLVRICREICRLGNLLDTHLQTEQANFSSPEPNDSR